MVWQERTQCPRKPRDISMVNETVKGRKQGGSYAANLTSQALKAAPISLQMDRTLVHEISSLQARVSTLTPIATSDRLLRATVPRDRDGARGGHRCHPNSEDFGSVSEYWKAKQPDAS